VPASPPASAAEPPKELEEEELGELDAPEPATEVENVDVLMPLALDAVALGDVDES
jgi:hypothetical protein